MDNLKILVAFAALYCCQAAIILTPRNPDDVGAAVTFNSQDGRGTYDFGYSEGHPSGASFRRESGDALGNKVGSFGLRDADGRLRVVRYVADENGFRADVTSNEPGVAPSDPASATINKPAVVPAPIVPVAPLAAYPPPLVYSQQKSLPPPPPPQYNYVYNDPPPPPPSFYGPPPPPAPVALAPKAYYGPPPPAIIPAPIALAPKAYYGPPPPVAIAAPVAVAPKAYYGPPPPLAVAPIVKAGPVGFAAFPPPPPAYFGNVVQGKGYVGAVRTYPSFLPPFAAVPPQFGYLNAKPSFQALGYPL